MVLVMITSSEAASTSHSSTGSDLDTIKGSSSPRVSTTTSSSITGCEVGSVTNSVTKVISSTYSMFSVLGTDSFIGFGVGTLTGLHSLFRPGTFPTPATLLKLTKPSQQNDYSS